MAETPRATAVCQSLESTTMDPAELSAPALPLGSADVEDDFPEGEEREARVAGTEELGEEEPEADGEIAPETEAEADPETEAETEVGGAPVEEPPLK